MHGKLIFILMHLTCALITFLASNNSWAKATNDSNPWEADIEAGAVLTSGNTNTSSLNTAIQMQYTTDSWLVKTKLTALNSKENNKTSKEKYTGKINYDKNLTKRWYLGLTGQQERDRFNGFYYQGSAAISLGYKLLQKNRHQLSLEVGPGYFRERARNKNTLNSENIARVATAYTWKINPNVELEKEYIIESGNKKTIQSFSAGLKSKLSHSLAAKLKFKTRHSSKVPIDSSSSDTETSLNLVYNF